MKILNSYPIGYKMALIVVFCTLSGINFAQGRFAPMLTSIYQDNNKQPGQRFGIDMKYFAEVHEKEYFIAWTYAYGENNQSDSDLMRFSMGCKTGDRFRYGMMASAIGYRMVNLPESLEDQYTASLAFTPLASYEINRYFYIESGLTLTAFQVGDFEVYNSYFLSLGMRWR